MRACPERSALHATTILLQTIGALAVQRLGPNGTDASLYLAAEVGADARSTIHELNDTYGDVAERTLHVWNGTAAMRDIVFDRLPPPPTDEDVDKFMSLQGLVASVPPRTDQVVWYLHVSKSAGSFFCDCGRKQGRNPGLRAFDNCHNVGEDYPVWGTADWPLPSEDKHTHNCSQMLHIYKWFGIDLEGNENFLPAGGEVCDNVYSVMIFRSPMHRLMSHLGYILRDDVWNLTPEKVLHDYHILADNFYVRSLRGYKTFKSPIGSITRQDLELAKQTLRKFKQVLIVDRDLTANVDSQLGWNCWDVEGRRSHFEGGTQRLYDGMMFLWGEEKFRMLEDLNEYDQELFEEARILARASMRAR